MVPVAGIEPATFGLQNSRSTKRASPATDRNPQKSAGSASIHLARTEVNRKLGHKLGHNYRLGDEWRLRSSRNFLLRIRKRARQSVARCSHADAPRPRWRRGRAGIPAQGKWRLRSRRSGQLTAWSRRLNRMGSAYLSSYVLMFGAEINSEFKKQTKAEGLADSTTLARELSGAQASENAGEYQIITPPRLAIGGQLAPRVTASDLGTGELLAAATRIIGLGRVGIATAVLSTIGLARLRHGRVGQGVAILGSAGLVAWLRRARPDQTGVIGWDAKNGG
jgi:hypothetical protein